MLVREGVRRLTSRADLTVLARWLEATRNPAAFRVLGLLRSNINRVVNCDVFANTWPRPSVVLIKPQQHSNHGYVDDATSIFATDPVACKETLLNSAEVLAWDRPWRIGGFDSRLLEPLAEQAQNHGGSLEVGSEPYQIAHISKEQLDSLHLSLPLGYYPSRLSSLHSSLLAAMWPTLGPEQMVHFLVKNFPSSCVRMAATGQIVGWTLARPDLGICAVHVAQNHRRHGIGQFMMASVARDLTCQGYLAFCFVSHSSSAALGMLNHLGFELNSDMEAVWAQYRPLDQQQRLAVGQQCLPH